MNTHSHGEPYICKEVTLIVRMHTQKKKCAGNSYTVGHGSDTVVFHHHVVG